MEEETSWNTVKKTNSFYKSSLSGDFCYSLRDLLRLVTTCYDLLRLVTTCCCFDKVDNVRPFAALAGALAGSFGPGHLWHQLLWSSETAVWFASAPNCAFWHVLTQSLPDLPGEIERYHTSKSVFLMRCLAWKQIWFEFPQKWSGGKWLKGIVISNHSAKHCGNPT